MKDGVLISVIVLLIFLSNLLTFTFVNGPRVNEESPVITQKVFTTYIPITFDIPKQIEAFVDGITMQGYTTKTLMQVPRITDAIVYANDGTVDHTIQYITGFDVIAVTTK